jgi:demethylspheroidene O-methyltransferase
LKTTEVAAYSALMSSSQPLVAEEILDAYPLDKYQRLLDLGGGEGAFLIAAAKRSPKLKLHLFDLPAVAERGKLRLEAAGLSSRAEITGGDFLTDPLPPGADVISLVRVIHDHDDAAALAIFRNAFRSLPQHGVLVLAEPMSGTPGAEAVGDAYFGFYLLAMGRGRPRSPEDLQVLLKAAGFSQVTLLRTRQPLQSRLMVARKTSVTDRSVNLS